AHVLIRAAAGPRAVTVHRRHGRGNGRGTRRADGVTRESPAGVESFAHGPRDGSGPRLDRAPTMTRLLWVLAFLLAAPACAALDGTEILKKVDRNLEPETYEA